jgi:hypothetical protein
MIAKKIEFKQFKETLKTTKDLKKINKSKKFNNNKKRISLPLRFFSSTSFYFKQFSLIKQAKKKFSLLLWHIH